MMTLNVNKKVTLDLPVKHGCVMDIIRDGKVFMRIDTARSVHVDIKPGDVLSVAAEGTSNIDWKQFVSNPPPPKPKQPKQVTPLKEEDPPKDAGGDKKGDGKDGK